MHGKMQRVMRTGNSLAVTIPASFVSVAGVRAGDRVQVKLWPDKGRVTYSFFGAKQLPLPGEIFDSRKSK